MHLRKSIFLIAAAVLITSQATLAQAMEEFEEVNIFFEQNVTDGDAELVVFAKGGDEGLKRLVVITPDHRRIVRFHAGEGELGMREFALESPEPGIDPVLDEFPEGEYVVLGRTFSGTKLMGFSNATHNLPDAPTGLSPADGDVVSASMPLTLSWDAVNGAEGYIVELESDDAELQYVASVTPDILAVGVPVELLVPGFEYQFSIAVENGDGNVSVVEINFDTTD